MNIRLQKGMVFLLELFVALALAEQAQAQQLVYQPMNPAFGGISLNYDWLLRSALAQQDPEEDDVSRFFRDPLADFQQNLQRQILSQLSREIILNRFGELDLTQEGRFDLGDFIVEITPGLNGVTITVTDVLTGDETVITIPSF